MASRTISAARLVDLLGSSASATPAYRGIADGLRLLIADGQVPAGTRLPSERELTAALDVSRTTVTRAYATLRDSGYATARQGSGTVAGLPSASGRRHGTPLLPTDRNAEGSINLTCAALPAPHGTAVAYEAAAAALPAYLDGTGYHALGLEELRERIADRYSARGLPTTPDQVMVTAGALGALAATLRAFLATGDRVLMESPTYPNAIAAVRSSGARPVALPLDSSGWATGTLEAALRQTSPRAAYLMPDFQNPTGALMPDHQREAVGTALRRAHTLTIVDETLVDLAGPEAPVPTRRPLAAVAHGAITLGSTSKAFWGGLRVGWLRAPLDLMPALTEARLTLDLGAPVLEQLVLVRLLEIQDAILRERRAQLAVSRAALAEALAEILPSWRFTMPSGGLSLWVELPEPMSTALTVSAERQGVLLAPGPQFAVEGGLERWIRLPYTASPDVLRDAVCRLELASRELGTGFSGRRRALAPLIA
jgi:DNA-binding transcriptional MocR family regulator